MKRKHSVKFIYFDVGGVILQWLPLLIRIADTYNKTLGEIHRAFSKHDPVSCRGLITSQELWERMLQDLAIVEKTPTNFSLLAMQCFSPIRETHALLDEIIDRVSVGILTNVHHGFFDLGIKHGHIPKLPYSAVVQSCHLGYIKPERQIFAHAQEKAGVEATHILLVDDYAENVEAAKKQGWQAIRFNTDDPQRSIRKIHTLIGHS